MDGDKKKAKRIWEIARVYEAAYWALDPDPAEAAGEVAYQLAQLVDEDEVVTTIRRILQAAH